MYETSLPRAIQKMLNAEKHKDHIQKQQCHAGKAQFVIVALGQEMTKFRNSNTMLEKGKT